MFRRAKRDQRIVEQQRANCRQRNRCDEKS
jgi:hypothetical protein